MGESTTEPRPTRDGPKRHDKPIDGRPLFEAWCAAADEWKNLRSEPAERRCRAARNAYYGVVLGHVPPPPPAAGEDEETSA
jgi:hypothetical protein